VKESIVELQNPETNNTNNPNELTWQDVKEMGLDPAPEGMIEETETT
jgi:hypothetical protein